MEPMPWIGRYRAVVSALIRFANVSQRTLSEHHYHSDYDLSISPQEWQVLEYLLEHPHNTLHMAGIADRLGMVPSTFSKCTQALVRCDLVERFRVPGNRKNIILRSTEKGKNFYFDEVERLIGPKYQTLFSGLAPLANDQLQIFADALQAHVDQLVGDKEGDSTLIKIEI